MSDVKTFTLRLPAGLYARCSEQARKKDLSLNAYMQESLDAVLKLEEDRALYEAFGRYGDEPNRDADVTFAFAAQKEALLRNESSEAR